ncbi:MAG: DUF1697 domain-containing protein [Nocardioidaceae bacterium]
MATWVALLRGVNVGTHNRLPMPALREALAAGGFDDVRTYVQSGNIVASSPLRSARRVESAVHDLVVSEFGLSLPVVVRRADALAAVVAGNPFPEAAQARPKLLHVSFLAGTPSADQVATLMAADAARDVCRIVGDHLYIDYADGVHGSKLTPAYLARRLGGIDGTARNWRTILTLTELSDSS